MKKILKSKTLWLYLGCFIIYYTGKHFGDEYHTLLYPKIDTLFFFKSYTWAGYSLGDYIYLLIGVFILVKFFSYLLKRQWRKLLDFITASIAVFYLIFQLFWGLNNFKTPLNKQLNIQDKYAFELLKNFTDKSIDEINQLHLNLTNGKFDKKINITYDESKFYEQAKQTLRIIPFLKGYKVESLTAATPSMYSYALSKTGFSGYFNPFVHTNQINSEIPTIGMPVTFTHEMIHQLGFSSEAEANFIACLAMELSSEPKYQYAAKLYALKFLLKDVAKSNQNVANDQYKRLNIGIQKNIIETQKFWKQKRNFSSKIFHPLYGNFLKINNQKDGMKTYNKMVHLWLYYHINILQY